MCSCLFFISSATVSSIPHLSFIVPVFAWNIPLVSLIVMKRSQVFPILLLSSVSLHFLLKVSFLPVFHIFCNSDLRWVYLSLSHRCFASLHFWGICKAFSDQSELTPISQWNSLHASLLLNCVPFYIFWIWTLIGHDTCQYFLYFILHFSFYWWFPMLRLSSCLFTFPSASFAFGIIPKLHCQDWCIGGTQYPFFSRS